MRQVAATTGRCNAARASPQQLVKSRGRAADQRSIAAIRRDRTYSRGPVSEPLRLRRGGAATAAAPLAGRRSPSSHTEPPVLASRHAERAEAGKSRSPRVHSRRPRRWPDTQGDKGDQVRIQAPDHSLFRCTGW